MSSLPVPTPPSANRDAACSASAGPATGTFSVRDLFHGRFVVTAQEVAETLGVAVHLVGNFFTRFRAKHCDCAIVNRPRRRGEPLYLYRFADICEALQHMVDAWAKQGLVSRHDS